MFTIILSLAFKGTKKEFAHVLIVCLFLDALTIVTSL